MVQHQIENHSMNLYCTYNISLVLQLPLQEEWKDPKNLPKIHSQKGLGALGYIYIYINISGQIIIFHQPRCIVMSMTRSRLAIAGRWSLAKVRQTTGTLKYPWNKGISLTKPPFGGNRSCEVAIIWSDISLISIHFVIPNTAQRDTAKLPTDTPTQPTIHPTNRLRSIYCLIGAIWKNPVALIEVAIPMDVSKNRGKTSKMDGL